MKGHGEDLDLVLRIGIIDATGASLAAREADGIVCRDGFRFLSLGFEHDLPSESELM
jgi:hypothetical protein